MTPEICICCGRPLEASETRLPGLVFFEPSRSVSLGGSTVRLTQRLFDIFDELQHAYPAGLTFAQLWERIYGDRLDADQPGLKTLQVHVAKLRKALAPIGLTVTHAPWSSYRLTRTGAPS